MRFRRKERESKTARKVAQVKERGGSSRCISRAVNTESLLPRYFFAPKPNGNVCYTRYLIDKQLVHIHVPPSLRGSQWGGSFDGDG